MQSQQR